ncbi:serine/threonine protein kinase [Polyangium aurulentum]|uniref:serine/threonine protein kinase n=1 Tax=Polyangium aurulentum TaxID=2567896 RepID=UPI00146B7E2C|nr:serine/threonine-protein kinase [Polyangium aurulentum]UQA61025.1 serine/threonine protein kinase [Polyangium aurulentum]
MSTDKITPGMVIAGRYRVVKQLGEGGVGAVFVVQHIHTDERLALKVLQDETMHDPTTIERFRAEARAPARIDSDHIVRVTDADVAPELGGAPYLVMELLKGRDLGAEITARGRLHPKEVLLYLRQTARALDKAHALGIVHRDLKPENIFLTVREDGLPQVKLLDFGIAKLTGAAADIGAKSKTKTGAVFGTPLYMAPEQARSQAQNIGPHTDVWALGLITTKLLTGADYWQAETMSDLIVQIIVDPIPLPSQKGSPFGGAFDAWFMRCCARDHTQRFRTASEAVTELARALGIVEGPHLVLEVAELLRAAHSGYAAPAITGAPLAIAQSAPMHPRATFPSSPLGVGPGAVTMGGATMLASSSDSSLHGTGSVQPGGGKKTALIIGGALALAAALGIAAFMGLRGDAPKPEGQTAAQAAPPAPVPTPEAKPPAPPEPPPVVAPASTAPAPVETAGAAATAPPATTKATTPPSTTGKDRGKTPSGPTPNKQPSDDDLMSGRR